MNLDSNSYVVRLKKRPHQNLREFFLVDSAFSISCSLCQWESAGRIPMESPVNKKNSEERENRLCQQEEENGEFSNVRHCEKLVVTASSWLRLCAAASERCGRANSGALFLLGESSSAQGKSSASLIWSKLGIYLMGPSCPGSHRGIQLKASEIVPAKETISTNGLRIADLWDTVSISRGDFRVIGADQ